MEDNEMSILHQEEAKNIDSFFSFDDGDFIIFYGLESALYDGKTLTKKQNLKAGSISTFFLITQTQYSIFNHSYFELYDFNQDRTSSKFIQSIYTKGFSTGNKIKKISNGDILVNSFYLGFKDVQVYRKNPNNNTYEIQNQFLTENLDDIIELNNNKELLGYKKKSESLVFKILNKDNYSVVKQNEVKFIINSKRRIHLKYEIYELCSLIGDKMIFIGPLNIYIFDTITLELETTINFNNIILDALISPKGDIILFSKEQCNFNEKYFINFLKIDYKANEIKKNEEKDVTNSIGEHKTLFKIFNYLDNGLVTIIDEVKIIIYKNFDLSKF